MSDYKIKLNMFHPIALLLMVFLTVFACDSGDKTDDQDQVDQSDDDSTIDDDDQGSPYDYYIFDDDDDDNANVTYDPDIPLCLEWNMDPLEVKDPVNINCLMERGDFAPRGLPAPDFLRVISWNIERGHSIDDYIFQFQSNPELSSAHILLLQEVDRHCTRTDYRNITRELAQALEMNYVFGVEFIELDQERGEHGNAILSEFPIQKVDLLRHTDFEKWYESQGQSRLGGRMSIMADVNIGDDIYRFVSVHYTSGVAYYFSAHNTQALETLEFIGNFEEPVIWGGDLNTGIYYMLGFEPAIKLIRDKGYKDALDHIPWAGSWTHDNTPPIPKMRLDWIFHKKINTNGGKVLREAPLDTLSDHLGIYADFPVTPH